MKCPVCKETDLAMTERQGVEIDYCPQCRGVWLDRGELDKIVERSIGTPSAATPPPPTGSYGHHSEHHGYHGGHYRRKSWLGEIFD